MFVELLVEKGILGESAMVGLDWIKAAEREGTVQVLDGSQAAISLAKV